MEKTLMLVGVGKYTEHSYTDRNGQLQTFPTRGFQLSDGIDTLYAEMQGDLARSHANTQFDLNTAFRMQLQLGVRKYTDSQGVERFSNEIRIADGYRMAYGRGQR